MRKAAENREKGEMNMSYLTADRLVSGQEGRAYLKTDGQNRELLYLKSVTASVVKRKTAVRTLGRRGAQFKSAGFSGSGKMVVYYVTSLFREKMLEYMKTGVDTSFDIVIINEDPQSGCGVQSMVLKNCNLDKVVLAKLDVSEDFLDEELSFTFEDAEMLSQFDEGE